MQVDKEAVMLLTDVELCELGLTAKGDRVKLKAFCSKTGDRDDRDEKKRRLKRIIEEHRSVKKKDKNIKEKPTLKFEIRWKHYSEEKSCFKLKRADQGGGVRGVDVSRSASTDDILAISRDLFFPNETVDIRDVELSLVDFNGNPLEDESFTAAGYKKKYGLNVPKLFLYSRLKREQQEEIQVLSDDSDEGDLLNATSFIGCYTDSIETSLEVNRKATSTPLSVGGTNHRYSDGLIGTSLERKQHADQLQEAYNSSLAADKEKDLKNQEEKRLESLRRSRELRLIPQPIEKNPRVVVRVQHPTLGINTRAFPPNCKVSAVYDWIGSLALLPEFFSLEIMQPRCTLYPDDDISKIASCTLHTLERETPIPLSKDEKAVSFFNGMSNSLEEDTLEDFMLPHQIMENDFQELPEEQSSIFSTLNEKRERVIEQMEENPSVIQIEKESVVEEMLRLFETDVKCKLALVFKDNESYGDGVLREVYATFWDNFCNRYGEGGSSFTFSVSSALPPNTYVALGRIITAQFLQTGTFPLQISQASIQHALFQTTSDECLISSFLLFLPEKDKHTVEVAVSGVGAFPTEELIDILSDFGIMMYPRPTNIQSILLKVALQELVSKPFMCLTKLREGMGTFWENISSDEISALYNSCSATPINVINYLDIDPEDSKEGKVASWLVRYVRNSDQKTLCRFLRFCTGSELVIPLRKVKVRMVNMSEAAIRPKAQTCFRILTVAKNYCTSTQLANNFDLYLNNPQLWDLHDNWLD